VAPALFYPVGFPQQELLKLVAGIYNVLSADLDVVEFTDEEGGTADRELAIPFLPGMDEVVVVAAQLRLVARTLELDVEYHVTEVSDGRVVDLGAPSRLLEIVLDKPTYVTSPTGGVHRVVRSAEPSGTGFTPGPPIFADPPFDVGPMYPKALGGMTVHEVAGNRLQLTLPGTHGRAFLVQFATGEDAAGLAPQPFASTVRKVRVDAAMSGLTLVATGPEETLLWSYPGAFLPDVGPQEIDFTPLAQQRLSARLDELGEAATPPATLALPLRLTSETAGRVAIREKTITATYRVHPLTTDPATVAVGGGWTRLSLLAPAGRRPTSGSAALTITHLGRELNGGSSEPPFDPPGAGVHVDSDRWAAAAVSFEPVAGLMGPLPLAAVRAFLGSPSGAEVVLELRADAAGAPGASLAPALVAELRAGGADWLELELAEPPTFAPPLPLWVVVRCTRGIAHWFADAPGAARISLDRGETWGEVDARLLAAERPLVQLFHQLSEPLPLPDLRLQVGASLVTTDLLAGAARTSPREFALDLELPDPVLDALGATSGSGRVPTELALLSRAAAELSLAGAELSYDPSGTTGA